MELPRHFKRFHANIQLNAERQSRITRGLERFTEFVGRDALGTYTVSAPVTQGSYRQGTIVRPLSGNPDYDVDVLLPMDLDRLARQLGGRREIFAYVHKRLKTEYDAGVQKRTKCLRISYAEGFRIDLVPGQPLENVGGPYKILDRERGEFIRTNPIGLNSWVSALNAETGDNFSAAVTLLKRWRDLQRFAKATAPKSIFLTVLAGTSYLNYRGEPKLGLRSPRAMTLQNLVSDIGKTMAHFMRGYRTAWASGPTRLEIPGSEGEDLLGRFHAKERFIERLDRFNEYAEKANTQSRLDFALNHWQRLFGGDFPRNA